MTDQSWANKLHESNPSKHTTHPANLVPFIFTSDKEQQQANLWYAMWINPSSLTLSYTPQQTVVYTKGGYGFFHWKNKPIELSFKGVSGWLRPNFVDDNTELGGSSTYANWTIGEIDDLGAQKGIISSKVGETFRANLRQTFLETEVLPGVMLGDKGIENTQTAPENNPRLFIRRIQRVATQEKYYTNSSGSYVLNKRRIKIYSKFLSGGTIVEGQFRSFKIKEDGKDSQLINYEVSFVITDGLNVDTEGTPSIESLFSGFEGFSLKRLLQ